MRDPRKAPGIENRRRQRRDGTVYWQFRVRWTDPDTGRRRVAVFDDQQDAIDFHASLRLARRRGTLADLDRGRTPIPVFVEEEWWPKYAAQNLSRNTLSSYASVWNLHLLPRLSTLQMRQLTPPLVQHLREDLEAAACLSCTGTGRLPMRDPAAGTRTCNYCQGRGILGAATVRRALAILQAICRYGVARGELASNPVTEIEKPAVTRQLTVVAISPAQVEQLLARLTGGGRVLALLMAYEGLRPEEALALEDRHIGRGALLVEQKNIDGQIIPGLKQRRRGQARDARHPALFDPVRRDLAAYRLATDRASAPDGRQLLIARPDGLPWKTTDYRNWRRRQFRPAVAAAGLPITRPYDLRHSAASLLIHAGWPLTDIAEHMGHTVQTLSKDYAHVIADMKGHAPTDPAAQIDRARRPRRGTGVA